MKVAKWVSFGISALSGVICLVIYGIPLLIGGVSFNEASTIGIIGGADGPTSIFVTKSFSPLFALSIIFLLSLLAGLFFCWKSKKS